MSLQDRHSDRRPDPDALLALAGGGRRGNLKVFLGAAPGVGKTYAMLQGARRLKLDGLDVVIGLVETHGRAETLALVEGLELLPRRPLLAAGRTIEEFDVDAALARKPKLLIVDELAHTNAPDCRHPKRWQDVEELLAAGIDVWTALNIQHLESLADVVSRVTGVIVRELVPDKVLQGASEVVLVDITPEELIRRLNDGKVYLPATARRATQNFFTPRNLTALRELALRRTADSVDDAMQDLLRQGAIEGPWQTSERLLACVGADSLSQEVVRTASRLATSLNGHFVAIHAERISEGLADAEASGRLDSVMQLAERLGGETVRLEGQDLAGEILAYARRENMTQIVVGRASVGSAKRFFRRSLPDEIIARARDISVHVVRSAKSTKPPSKAALAMQQSSLTAFGIAAAVVSVALAVGIGEAIQHFVQLPNLSMVFLAAVLFCATRFGVGSAVAASLLSFLAYNFFFLEPLYTFTIAEPQELFALLAFLAVSILTGSLAGRVRDQSENVRRRANTTLVLLEFSRKIASASSLDDVLWAAAAHTQKALRTDVVLCLPENTGLLLRAAWPPGDELELGEQSAARWAFDKGEAAGWRTGTLPNTRYQFRPLVTPRGIVGVCGFKPPDPARPMSTDDERLLASILEQTAVAIDRAQLTGTAVIAAALDENEKLRTTLLASLSHDLRTPLASIIGAASSLRELGDQMPAGDRSDLLVSIEEEAGRLARFVANLLDMSRIESGALKLKRDWVDVADAARIAVERARKLFPDLDVQVSLAKDLPFIRADAHLVEQVLFNLLDNAHKYGGQTPVAIHARPEAGDVVISVTDEGNGVKPDDLEKIFEKFYRGGRSDGRKVGTGLGLSICRGLVTAMGGSILAQSPAVKRRGTRIVLRFPAALTPKVAK